MNTASTLLCSGWVSFSVSEAEELSALSSLSIVTNFFNLHEGIKKSVMSVGRGQVPFNFNQSRKCGDQIFDGERQSIRGFLCTGQLIYICNTFYSGHTHTIVFC